MHALRYLRLRVTSSDSGTSIRNKRLCRGCRFPRARRQFHQGFIRRHFAGRVSYQGCVACRFRHNVEVFKGLATREGWIREVRPKSAKQPPLCFAFCVLVAATKK
jgi:hypothetical protein